jgi:hypothetical protein
MSMVVSLIYLSVFIFALMLVTIMLNIKYIMFGFNAMFKKRKGFGLICIVGHNFSIKLYFKKFVNDFEIDGSYYKYLPHFVVRLFGLPAIFFYEGDSKPIDMLKRARDKVIPADLMGLGLKKARLQGGLLNENKQDKMMFIMLLSNLGISAIVLYFLLKSSGMM